MNQNIQIPAQKRSATFTPTTVDTAARTVVFCASTGATVRRVQWVGWDIEEFTETLRIDNASIRLNRVNAGAPLLDSHCCDELEDVLGVTTRGWIEGGELLIECKFSEREDVQPYWVDVQQGILRNVSIGYIVHKYQDDSLDDDKIKKLTAVDWEVLELSLVPIPADAGAQVRSMATTELTHPCVITLRDFPAQTLEQPMTQPTAAPGATPTPAAPELTSATTAIDTRNDVATAITAERHRTAELRTIARAANLGDAWLQTAIDSGMAADAARAHAINTLADTDSATATRNHTTIQTRGAAPELAQGLESAIMARASGNDAGLTDAGRQFRHNTWIGMGREWLEANGLSTRGLPDSQVVSQLLQKRDFGVSMQTTTDFSGILANVATKVLMKGYQETERTFQQIGSQRNLKDYKSALMIALGATPSLLEVPEHAEYKDGTMGEVTQMVKLAKYGRIISISEEALINDDMNIFSTVPARMGAAAARLESDLFYGQLLSNPTINTGLASAPTAPLFAAAAPTNNQIAGALSVATLNAAFTLMAKQTGLSGEIIQMMPAYIVHPPEQNLAVAQLLGAIVPNQTAQVNPFVGKLKAICEPRLSAASFAGNSATACFLVADPAMADTISYGYLDGQSGVVTTRQHLRSDGIEIKIKHPFYAKAMDFRGMVKMLGV